MFISYNIKWYTGVDGMCFYIWYIAFGKLTLVAEQCDNAEKATLAYTVELRLLRRNFYMYENENKKKQFTYRFTELQNQMIVSVSRIFVSQSTWAERRDLFLQPRSRLRCRAETAGDIVSITCNLLSFKCSWQKCSGVLTHFCLCTSILSGFLSSAMLCRNNQRASYV